jgi:hypothetical protein
MIDIESQHRYFAEQRQKQDQNNFGRFQAIGIFKTNTNNQDTDLIEAITSVTPAAQTLFIEIKRNHTIEFGICNYNLIARLKDANPSAYKVFSRHIVALTKAGLIKRITRKVERHLEITAGHNYMINPNLVRCKQFSEAKGIWLTLTKQ